MRIVTRNGQTYPTWVFNDVGVRPTRDPNNKIYLYAISGTTTHPAIWSYGTDGRTVLPQPDAVFGGCR